MDSKKLFLLDAYALIYRSYYAFIKNPRINSKGINTSASFGFTNTLLEIIQKEKPSHIAVVFDPPGPTFRHKEYPEYKANRPPTPEDIKQSVPHIKEIIAAFNIPIIEVEEFEADDVIGTLAKKAEKDGFQVYMMTPDKDYCQLVSDNIYLYKPRRSGQSADIWGIPEVCERYGIKEPMQVVDILALMGDSADNIPGARGVGEKGAGKLIKQYQSIESVYDHIDEIKGKQKENLEESKDAVYFSKKLITISLEAPVDFDPNDFVLKEHEEEALKAVFEKLEFSNLMKRLLVKETRTERVVQASLFGDEPMQETENESHLIRLQDVEHRYQLLDSIDEIQSFGEALNRLKEFCFDTETGSLDTLDTKLAGISFSWEKNKAFYIPIPEDPDDEEYILDFLKPAFLNPEITKIGQNIKFDLMVLQNHGIEMEGPLFDTMLAHYLLEADMKHNMDFLAEKYLNYSCISIEELIGPKGKNQKSMLQLKPESILNYAAEDADITYQLKTIFEKELRDNNLYDLFREIEMPLVPVLAYMEQTGVSIDKSALDEYAEKLRLEIIRLEKEIIDLAGVDFNVSSPKQLGEVLFERMKIIDHAKKTKSKQYSTSEDVLSRIADKHEIIPKVLEFRGLKKLLSTYVEALPKLVHPKTNRIHSSYNQAVASTGRLSSTNPNLQNIPIRDEEGREIRKAFIPENQDYIFLSADYSQIELRLIADLSNDENLIKAFNNHEDIHTATAAKIFSLPNSEVSQDMRRKAKTANFGIIYGISAFGLSQRLNIPRKEAKEIIDSYFQNYPSVKEYMDNNIRLAREKGYVSTLLGRKRSLRDINSRNSVVRGIAERNAINAPVQGSAADIIKIAMIRIYQQMKDKNMKSRMILQVHDELNFEAHHSELEALKNLVRTEMESAYALKVPLIVDMDTGSNWYEAH